MRILLGIVAGIIVAVACVAGIEAIGHSLYPPPAGLDLNNPADLARLTSVLPMGAFVAVIVAWFVGALAGAIAANLIARRTFAGWIVAALVICAGVATMLMIPHPVWMWVAGIGLPLVAGFVAQRVTPTAA